MREYVSRLDWQNGNAKLIDLVQDTFTIGRAPYNDVCIPIPTISGEHAKVCSRGVVSCLVSCWHDRLFVDQVAVGLNCQLVKVEGGLRVTDLESTNGTFIEGDEITDAVLALGQQVVFGDPHLSSYTLVDE